MKRFVIFICPLPGIAVAVLIAIVGAGAFSDSRTALELAGKGEARCTYS